MFKREREFNIITGQTAPNFIGQRSKSCASQLQNYRKAQQLSSKIYKLGTPRDRKEFQYSYFDGANKSMLPRIESHAEIKQIKRFPSMYNNSTMLNYVSTGYNIINHTNQIETAKVGDKAMFQSVILSLSKKMPEVFKKSPLTEHIHRARMYAPNYHENYEKRTDGHEFNKKKQLCAQICQIQKTYGQSKYFRKLK